MDTPLTIWLQRLETNRPKNAAAVTRNKRRKIQFSAEDSILMHVNWSIDTRGYPVTLVRINGRPRRLRSGRVVLRRKLGRDLLPGEVCDHLNGNRRNNRRDNLRATTQAENVRNVHARRSKSGFVGVVPEGKRWAAQIQVNKKMIRLGAFTEPIDAAKAYNAAAEKHGFLTRNQILPGKSVRPCNELVSD